MKYPQLAFRRDANQVQLILDIPNLCMNPVFSCYRNSNMDAQLLHEYLEQALITHLKVLKKAAYDRGYKDGRAKAAKKQNFCGDFDHSESM